MHYTTDFLLNFFFISFHVNCCLMNVFRLMTTFHYYLKILSCGYYPLFFLMKKNCFCYFHRVENLKILAVHYFDYLMIW